MRVISGKLKGRMIYGYDILGTRPTMDRVKESIFSMIQNNIFDATILDLFAGSGNLGIEAISNGAKLVYFNDNNKKCISTIKDNLIRFDILDRSVITNMDYEEALNYYQNQNVKFDLVFLDPPYKMHIVRRLLLKIIDKKLLNKNGILVCEVANEIELFTSEKLVFLKEKTYGDKKVVIYKYDN